MRTEEKVELYAVSTGHATAAAVAGRPRTADQPTSAGACVLVPSAAGRVRWQLFTGLAQMPLWLVGPFQTHRRVAYPASPGAQLVVVAFLPALVDVVESKK